MGAPDFTVKCVVNEGEVRRIVGRIRDVQPPLRTVAREKLASIQKQFATNSNPDGNPWQPLKPSTLRTKRVNRDKILTRSGKMGASFTADISKANLLITTTSDIAVYHQFGTVKMVRRLILKFTDKDRQRIKKLITVYITAKK